MKVIPGDRNDQWRCINDQGMLIGLITLIGPQSSGTYRVDFLMQIEATTDSQAQALGFVNGAWAMAQALGRVKPTADTHNQPPPILQGLLKNSK